RRGDSIREGMLEPHQFRPIQPQTRRGHTVALHVSGVGRDFGRAYQNLLRIAAPIGARPAERPLINQRDPPASLPTLVRYRSRRPPPRPSYPPVPAATPVPTITTSNSSGISFSLQPDPHPRYCRRLANHLTRLSDSESMANRLTMTRLVRGQPPGREFDIAFW